MRQILSTTAVATAGLLLGGIATAAPATAVQSAAASQTVTARYDCGAYGVTDLTIEASASGGAGSVRISTSGGLAPFDIPADSISATLRLERAAGGTVAFSGTANDAAAAGQPVTIGPLTGAVSAGDSLDSYVPAAGATDVSLSLNVLGIVNSCNAVGKQTPGPIVF
ncbi:MULTISPECIES: hypothetical protein [Streptomyces]|uniref:Uncharacterized protein n=1 Tax=Streptomyces changanensis TaxID=2964669 RepID=A0ABY5N680_9ACTN|nr:MULTISPECIES: hypothetical protein [Streptomyces]UUS31121.1 hypothetical protein NRO40_09915 [Streptomyces changanensis]